MKFFGVDSLIEDHLHRNGVRRIIYGPSMPAFAHINRQLRYLWLKHMFKDSVLILRHEDVRMSVDLLAETYSSARDGIKRLHIEWQRTKPVDYRSFRRLCGILSEMPRLSIPHLVVPADGSRPYRVRLTRGLWNALVWHKDKML